MCPLVTTPQTCHLEVRVSRIDNRACVEAEHSSAAAMQPTGPTNALLGKKRQTEAADWVSSSQETVGGQRQKRRLEARLTEAESAATAQVEVARCDREEASATAASPSQLPPPASAAGASQLPPPEATGPAQRESLGFSQLWGDDEFQGEALEMLAAAEAQQGGAPAQDDLRSDSSEVPTDLDEPKAVPSAAVASAAASAVASAAVCAAASAAAATAGPLAGLPFRLRYALQQAAGGTPDALFEACRDALRQPELAAVRAAFDEGGLRAVRKLVEDSKRVGGPLAKALPRPLGSDDAPLPLENVGFCCDCPLSPGRYCLEARCGLRKRPPWSPQ